MFQRPRQTLCDENMDELARFAEEPAMACHQHGHRMRDYFDKQRGPSHLKKNNHGKSTAGKRGDGDQKRGSFYRTKTHSGEECSTQQKKKRWLPVEWISLKLSSDD